MLKKLFKSNTKDKKNINKVKNKNSKDCKNSRRSRGTGSIIHTTKRGKECYIARYTIGIDSKGKPIRKEFICTSEEEADKLLKNFIKTLKTNPILKENDFTLEEWLKYYLDIKAVTCKPATLEKDEAIFKNYILINRKLSRIKIRELTTNHLQKHYDQLILEGKDSSTLKNNNKSLIAALNRAIKQGYININPAGGVVLPKGNTKDKYPYLSANDRNKFLNSLSNSKVDLLLKFALLTGMRIGEILALTWSDICFEKREIYVTKSVDRVKKDTLKKIKSYEYKMLSPTSIVNNDKFKTVLVLGPTKNNKNRIVPISLELIDDLYSLFNNKSSNILFCNSEGFYIDVKQPQRRFEEILNSNMIRKIPLHGLRHTFASMLYYANVDIATAAEILGDSIKTTMDFYIHISPDKKLDGINKLDNYLSKDKL